MPFMHANYNFGRRHFLASIGASAALTPFLPLLEAEADQYNSPKRIILMFHPHGVMYDDWLPTGTEHDWTLSKMLEPLAAHKDNLIVLDGLTLPDDAGLVGPPEGGPHTRNTSHLWSGAPLANDGDFSREDTTFGWGIGTSIDQTAAEAIGMASFYRSLEFGVRVGLGSAPHNRMIYRAPGEPLEPSIDPKATFERIFSDFSGDDLQELARLRARRLSVLDAVYGDLEGLNPQVSAGDRNKIEAHLDAIRTVEQRLNSDIVCEPPPMPEVGDSLANDNMPFVAKHQIDLMVQALACDLTRVASIQFDRNENSDTRFSWLFNDDRNHHTMSHDPSSQDQLTQIYAWYSQQLAYLMDSLRAIPEGDGTMLDNTLIVWGTEVGDPVTHQCNRMPFVLAGGVGGALPMGRFLRYEGVQHNRLLVSVANLMGLNDVTSYGTTDMGSGPLPGLV